MAINEVPIGTYTDATGIVDATAAAEIVVLIATLKGFLPDPDDVNAGSPAEPNYGMINPQTSKNLRAEIDALASAIAAAPAV